MREIDPFSYYPEQASAIAGFGGENTPIDPRYCFHTDYINVRPGAASYQLQLQHVRATRGRLELRVHALRREPDAKATFVAGARIDVMAERRDDLSASVQFIAQPNTRYAFYGKFLKDTDAQADAVLVSLDEASGPGENYVEPPFSALRPPPGVRDERLAKPLFHVVSHHLFAPVSQECTAMQMVELKRAALSGHGVDDWAEALCLNALSTYGVTGSALEGLVIGHCSDRFTDALARAGYAVRPLAADPPPPEGSDVFGDFLVWPEGLWPETDAARRWNVIKAWLARLKIGGIGIVTCRLRPADARPENGTKPDETHISKLEIERWALHLIAEGYAVAPLAFAAAEDRQLDDAGLSRFALIVRRI